MKYYIINPTGNITAIIESEANLEAARKIMEMYPEVEQVGFVTEGRNGADISVEMAGGEFCGNASMSAAKSWLNQKGKNKGSVKLYFSGTGIVNVEIDGEYGSVEMPKPLKTVSLHGFPCVVFPGIAHVILEEKLEDPESKIKEWAEELDIGALGFMFVDNSKLTPLVYVKNADTLFWESSCASGTTAAGEYYGKKVSYEEPGGVLTYENGKLSGSVETVKTGYL